MIVSRGYSTANQSLCLSGCLYVVKLFFKLLLLLQLILATLGTHDQKLWNRFLKY